MTDQLTEFLASPYAEGWKLLEDAKQLVKSGRSLSSNQESAVRNSTQFLRWVSEQDEEEDSSIYWQQSSEYYHTTKGCPVYGNPLPPSGHCWRCKRDKVGHSLSKQSQQPDCEIEGCPTCAGVDTILEVLQAAAE